MTEKMRSCVMGLILGQFSSPLPMAQTPEQKEPVAYLYNGVRLPKLPEWDRETYPYAAIGKDWSSVTPGVPIGTHYVLKVFAVPRSVGSDGSLSFNIPAIGWTYYNDAWCAMTEYTEDNSTEGADGTYFASFLYGPYWANFDLVTEDGTTILSASDPIPVYE